MFATIPRRFAVFVLLALSMAVTRFGHAGGTAWLLPDASWAVFFVGGFYLARAWRWALALLLIEAVGIDSLAIRHYGVSNYCLTAAYWFIVPAYSALWLGGAWLRRHAQQVPLDLVRLLASLTVSVTICYLLTQASFYWLGRRVEHPSVSVWWSNLTDWYGHFLTVSCTYVALAALVHSTFTSRSRWLLSAAWTPGTHVAVGRARGRP
jgi:hypothetical protein